jgi:hypothetical protein
MQVKETLSSRRTEPAQSDQDKSQVSKALVLELNNNEL